MNVRDEALQIHWYSMKPRKYRHGYQTCCTLDVQDSFIADMIRENPLGTCCWVIHPDRFGGQRPLVSSSAATSVVCIGLRINSVPFSRLAPENENVNESIRENKHPHESSRVQTPMVCHLGDIETPINLHWSPIDPNDTTGTPPVPLRS